ncbi:MAG TPA: carboxypeptidase-like regulatory domain-containing protein, partial [Terriglobales bacterium]|nr:carboxypeptidase-like regulatory domain-containing protein [Terriglobales bacterium]
MRQSSTALRILATLLFAVLVSRFSPAQQITGTIRGTIVDPNGAVVSNATVTAAQMETGLVRSTVAGRDGSYVFLELPIGHYQLQVQSQNFEKYLQQGISLNVNQVATVNIHLRVGSDKEQVDVQADAALVQEAISSLGETVTQRQILDLPLDGRNFSQLGTLQPGVVPLTPGLLEAGGPARQNQAYAVDGQRPESNNFMIDGADN